jgi:hypothetical protein
VLHANVFIATGQYFAKPPRDAFLIQLREAREEWRRRLRTRKTPSAPAA